MMTKLRENTAIILWIVIFAFVGLIVVEWGADYTRTSSNQTGDIVGVVNGLEIGQRQFRDALKAAARGEEDKDEGQLVREVWDLFVRELLVSQEVERLGIEVTDGELTHYTLNYPPPQVQQIPDFQTDGEFDPDKYSQFVATGYRDPQNRQFFRQIEQLQKQRLTNDRLQRLLRETVQVSPEAVRQHYAEHNERVTVEYVFAPASSVGDDEVTVEAADLEAYYQEHLHEYHNPEQIRVAYVLFPKVATAEDSTRVAAEIGRVRQEILDGADFAEMAEALSEDVGTAPEGGDLGTFGRGRMVKPFEEAAFALEEGEMSEPVLSPFGWHLIKLDERVEEDGDEKLKARHILLKIEASRQTEAALRQRVEDFQAVAEQRGFEAAARIDSQEVQTSPYVARGGSVPGLGSGRTRSVGTTWLVNQFFDSEVGAIRRSGHEQALWVAKLQERRPEGTAPLDEVRARIERQVLNRKKAEKAGERLAELRAAAGDGAGLESSAAAADLRLQRPEAFSRMETVPQVGRRNAFVGAAFRLAVDELSEVVTTSRGSYLIHLLSQEPIDEEMFQKEREQAAQELLRQRHSEAVQVWFTELYESAEIEDNRHFFFFSF